MSKKHHSKESKKLADKELEKLSGGVSDSRRKTHTPSGLHRRSKK
ncbi:hypothetical protein [Legionella quinlivanii]|nr:hypothetical protein [Legionella quinlivanii]MCW8449613.1 hypothetical protein [Legionella quinlivanii]